MYKEVLALSNLGKISSVVAAKNSKHALCMHKA